MRIERTAVTTDLQVVSQTELFHFYPLTLALIFPLILAIVSGTSGWGCFSTLDPRSTPRAGLGLTLCQSCFCQVVIGLVINCVEEGKAQWPFPPLILL